MLVITSGKDGVRETLTTSTGVSNAKLQEYAGIAVSITGPPKVPGNCNSKTQVTKWGPQLKKIIDATQTFTFADWRYAVLAALNAAHTVMVGKKRVVAVGAGQSTTFYANEELVYQSKTAILGRVAKAPGELNLRFAGRSSKSAAQSFAAALSYKTLIYQAAYMSGDMFAVGAALRLNGDTRVLLIYESATEAAAKKLFDFYQKQCGGSAARILAVEVPDAKDQYKKFGAGWPAKPTIEGELTLYQIKQTPHVLFQSPGGATAIVGKAIGGNWGSSTLRQDWATTELYHKTKIDRFLAAKGITPNGRYVILWTRFSGKGATLASGPGAHPELDISYELIRQVIAQRTHFNRSIIIVGPDRHGKLAALAAPPHVQVWGEYYRVKWTRGMDRAMEYAVFTRMQEDPWNCDVVHLGMRSGAMDAAALLNMKTYFIEDAANQQLERTQKWTGTANDNDYYKRIDVANLPTLTGQILHIAPTMPIDQVQLVKKLLKFRARTGPDPGRVPTAVRDAANQLAGWQRGLGAADVTKIVTALT